jgi:GAF domain-containing protein
MKVVSKFEIQNLCGQLDRREISFNAFIENCCRYISQVIGCSRAGIWLFEEVGDEHVLRCLGIYDQASAKMTLAPDETPDKVQPYFHALTTQGYVLAVDATLHPATAGFFGDKLGRTGVRSLMASAFSLNGEVFGAFTCTQLNEIAVWTPLQLAILKQIGARVSLALAGASRTIPATLPMGL